MYNLREIVKRYNDSVSDYAAYLVAVNEHQSDAQEQHLRNAGEGFSQVLEQSLKLHAQSHSLLFARYATSSTPTVIRVFYLDDAGVPQQLYGTTVEAGITPTVDFAYMKTHKRPLTNESKHEGGTVDPDVVEAYMEQCRRFIHQYLDKKALLRDTAYFMDAKQDHIQQFYVSCDHFQHDDRTFILLTDQLQGVDKRQYRHFSLVPWDLVIDFHSRSCNSGFSAGAYRGGASVAHIFKSSDVVTPDDLAPSMRRPLYYYANGFKNERTCTNYDEWNRVYYTKLDAFLNAASQGVITQKTIVVSLLHDEEFTDNLRTLVSRYYTNVKVLIVNDLDDSLLGLAKRRQNYFEHINISLDEMSSCFNEYLRANKEVIISSDTFSLPYIQGEGSGLLTKAELQDLQECFEVLYGGIGDGSDQMAETFLRGVEPLSWQGAKRDFAAKRDHFLRMYVKPMEAEIKKARSKVYLMHEPGYGGTTVARQLAYHFHESYPVLYLTDYRSRAVIQKLDWLHERTKKTLLVFMEIPSVISADDFEYLYSSTNQSRPYIFVGIMRGHATAANSITVTDWGLDTVKLSDKYSPVIEDRYTGSERDGKLAEVHSILQNGVEPYKRTPFYFGMLTYEKDFVAANGFFEKFVNAIQGNELKRKFLIYLALCDVYADKPIPEAFFKIVFGVPSNTFFKIERFFSEEDGIFESLVQNETAGKVRYFRPKYAFFSKTLLQKLLRKENTPEDIGWKENLGTYVKDFIYETARSSSASYLEENVLKPLLIGSSKERDGERFTDLVEDIQKEERIVIFKALHEQYPDNPHFCSHLARFYAMEEKNMQLALDYADRAISLSPNPDPLLHHMKGMCLFYIISDRIEAAKRSIKAKMPLSSDELTYITETLLSQAELEFQKSREIQQRSHHEDEYGYIPNIKLLIRVFDFYVQANGETKRNVIANAKEPYCTWLDKAHTLLDNASRLHEEGNESEHFLKCETAIWAEYEDYSSLIEKLNNQLVKTPHPALVRRQLAQLYMRRDNEYKTNVKANERILSLMNDNMKSDARNISNFLLWFRAARYSSTLKPDDILAQLAQWYAANPAIDLAFYSFVFNAIKAIDGSSEALVLARKYLQECRALGGNNRIYVKEWFGKSPQGIISNYERQESPESCELYEVQGYVKEYQHPGNAIIELDCGLEVFFKPSVNGITASSLNHDVKFFMGFSYDGLKADNESVKIIE